MPKTKLTLSVDASVIERAKRFSRRNQTTVSKLVSEFLAGIGDEDAAATPRTLRLRGVLPPDVSLDDYRTHLVDKHT